MIKDSFKPITNITVNVETLEASSRKPGKTNSASVNHFCLSYFWNLEPIQEMRYNYSQMGRQRHPFFLQMILITPDTQVHQLNVTNGMTIDFYLFFVKA